MKTKNSKQVESLLKGLYDDLEKGNNAQVFEAYQKAIEKVLQNPTSREFIKYDTEEYRAVDVLAQRRAFFKIHSKDQMIFFVWLNPEDYPHDSSKGENDPCYKEFKRLLKNGKLEEFAPEVEEDPEFIFYGEFRKNARFYTSLKTSRSFSGANLHLITREENEYEITNIHEDPYYSDALPLLLTKIVEKAKEVKINLVSVVELARDVEYRTSIAKALQNAGFAFSGTDSIGDTYMMVA